MGVDTKNEVSNKQANSRLTEVVIGVLIAIDANGQPLVVFPGNQSSIGVPARATVVLTAEDIGCEVALLFENGNPAFPLAIGRIQNPESRQKQSLVPLSAELDGEYLEFTAKKEIVLKCGKASITLTRAGKILIRGTYLLSRSTGSNRIKGGSVQLN